MADVLLVGSGVSIFDPNGLPNGKKVTEIIVRRLLQGAHPEAANAGWLAKLAPLVEKAPFEQIFNRYPDKRVLKAGLAAVYGRPGGAGQTPDIVHEALHDLIKNRGITTVFTTNYDTKIEDVSSIYKPRVIIEERDLKLPVRDYDLIKIHGCVSRFHTIVATIEEEPVPEPWKLKLLLDRINGHELEIFGYSGLDFDLTELILTIGASKVVWNIPSWDSLSVNAAEADRRGWVQRRAFETSLPLRQKADLSSLVHRTEENELDPIFNSLNECQLAAWRINLLQDMSQASAAIELLASGQSQALIGTLAADLMERTGLYQHSRAVLKASYRRTGNAFEQVSILHARAGRSYTSARTLPMLPDLFRAWILRRRITNPREQRFVGAVERYLLFLFFKGLLKHFSIVPGLKELISLKILENSLKNSAVEFAQLGKRQQFNLCKIQLEEHFRGHRIAIPEVSENYFFIEAAASFEHLANSVGQFSARRKVGSVSEADARAAVHHLYDAGLYPEVWKHVEKNAQFYGSGCLRSVANLANEFDIALDCLAACEYPRSFKALKAITLSRKYHLSWALAAYNALSVQSRVVFDTQRMLLRASGAARRRKLWRA